MYNMDNTIISNLYCPITKQLINEPVVCDDGQTYEYSVLMEYFESSGNNKSPLTGKEIKKYFYSYTVKNIIDEFIKQKSTTKRRTI